MRLTFCRTRSQTLLYLGAFLLAMLCSFLLSTAFNPVRASTSSLPVEITQGWQYRWGDSPVDSAGIPIWTEEDASASGWKRLGKGERIQKTKPGNEIAWLRVPLPQGQWKSPTLYWNIPSVQQKADSILEIYLDEQQIAKLASLDARGKLKPESDELNFIPLASDISGKSLFLKVSADRPGSLLRISQDLRLGSHADLIRRFFQENLKSIVNLILGGFYLLLGLATILLGLRSHARYTYLSFGLLVISTGLSTGVNNSAMNDMLIPQIGWSFLPEISNRAVLLALLLIPGFICAFFEQVLGKGHKNIIRRLWQSYLLFTPILVAITILCFTGYGNPFIWDIFRLLFLSHFLLLLLTTGIILAHCIPLISKGNHETKIFALGFILLLVCFATDVFSSTYKGLFEDVPFLKDNLFYLGMLCFIALLGWLVQRRFAEANSRLKAYATELEAKNVVLQEMDKLKDEFLANTSHELRTPLNGIIGIAESLMDGATGKLSQPTVFNLSLIVSSGRRLTQLVNDLLDFSRLKHQTIALQIKPIGIREITHVVLMLSQPLIGKKSLQLVNSISPDIPLVDADENRVQQILHNLIGNAIKFTETGVIEVSAAVAGNNLEITVSDTGIGIPSDKIDRIFEAFEQADGSIAREYGGAGLGLAVTRQLVQLHGGEIWVKSEPGKGSQFTFTLPLSQEKMPIMSLQKLPEVSHLQEINGNGFVKPQISGKAEEAWVETSNAALSKVGFKVLIVDDEPVNLQVLVNHLSLQNYVITQASNGTEALAAIEQGFQPDLIVLDVMMPKMTGYEVCKKLREKFPATELPVVLLTAKNQVSDLVEGFDSGANDYLTKPISKNELLARIKTHIQLSKINLAYGRFVPREFLEFLERESIIDVQLGDQVQQEMTVLFSDIRSFTTLSENMTPKENFDFINEYLRRVGPVIRNHNGFIDKYIGDAVMALFPKTAEDAIQAAIAMQHQVSLYNLERQANGYPSIAIGVGLHTGTLMLGTVGEEERMESTVIADAVNLASRMEGLTKVYGAGILISEQTLSKLNNPSACAHRFIGHVTVKGKKTAVGVYEVYQGDFDSVKALKNQTRAEFERAVELYELGQFTQAQRLFDSVAQKNEQDRPAKLYAERSQTAGNSSKDGIGNGVVAVQENR